MGFEKLQQNQKTEEASKKTEETPVKVEENNKSNESNTQKKEEKGNSLVFYLEKCDFLWVF